MKKTLTILLICILLVGVGVAFTVLADTTEGSNSTINTESLAGSPAIPEISQVELEPRIDFEALYTVSGERVVLSVGEKLSAIKEDLSKKKQSLSVTEFEQILGTTASLMKQYEKIEIPYTKEMFLLFDGNEARTMRTGTAITSPTDFAIVIDVLLEHQLRTVVPEAYVFETYDIWPEEIYTNSETEAYYFILTDKFSSREDIIKAMREDKLSVPHVRLTRGILEAYYCDGKDLTTLYEVYETLFAPQEELVPANEQLTE